MTIFNALNRPLTEWDSGQRWGTVAKLTGMYLGAIALTTAANLALPWDSLPLRYLRILGTAGGLGLAALTLRENRELVRLDEVYYARQMMRVKAASKLGDQDIDRLLNGIQGMMQQPADAPQPKAVPPFPTAEFIEASTGVCIMGGSGSGKTCVAQHLLNNIESQITVLDPHADRSHPEYPWGALPVTSDKSAIFEQMRVVMSLIEQRDRTPMTIVCDEWTSTYAHAKRAGKETQDLCVDFIISMATEGRKFGKFLILIGHSDNVKLYGLDGLGGLLQNFSLLRLGDIATRYVKNSEDRETAASINETAYPLLWGDRQFVHPTHGSYPKRKKGLPPVGLLPLVSAPSLPAQPPHGNHTPPHAHDNHTVTHGLESLFTLACGDSIPDEEKLPTGVSCPACGSTRWKSNGSKRTAKGNRKRAKCEDCGKSFYLD
jgi:hypothetical protein